MSSRRTGSRGNSLDSTGRSTSSRGQPNSAVVSAAALSKLTADPFAAPSPKDAVVISASELTAMQPYKELASSTTNTNRAGRLSGTSVWKKTTSKRPEQSPEVTARAKERKEKMLKLEQDRKKQKPLTEGEQLAAGHNSEVVQHANRAQDEQEDDVKNMNQMMLYAKCVTIRDAQILEKRAMQTELEAEEKRLDAMMEYDRLKAVQEMEERERIRTEEQKEGSKVLIQQIEARKEERLKQQELREQEAQLMIQRIKQLEAKEEQDRVNKVIEGRKLLEQVMQANNAQARAKLRKKQEEIEEDMRIAEYIKQKDAREAEEEAEKQRIIAEKEKEIARLRAQQERAQDRQSEIDELRAKRYQEARDRKWREEQTAEAQKRAAQRREIAEAREQQRIEKEQRMAEQALQEKAEFLRVLEAQKGTLDEEQRKIEEAKQRREGHRNQLLTQIVGKEKSRTLERKKFLEEGDIFARQIEQDKKKLETLKQEKLKALEKAGVPEKYRTELAKKKVLVASIH